MRAFIAIPLTSQTGSAGRIIRVIVGLATGRFQAVAVVLVVVCAAVWSRVYLARLLQAGFLSAESKSVVRFSPVRF